jgi:hypothetical protein
MRSHSHHLTKGPSTPAEAPPAPPTRGAILAHIIGGGTILPQSGGSDRVVLSPGASNAQKIFAVRAAGGQIERPPVVRQPEDYSDIRGAMRRQKSDDLVGQAVPQLVADMLKRRGEYEARQGGVASAAAPAAAPTAVMSEEARAGWLRRLLQRRGEKK